jgi:hypothetical protein
MATKQIIMRVELKGQPDGGTYQRLHQMITGDLKWETQIQSNTGSFMPLPSATYCGATDIEPIDLAVKLRDQIVRSIWPHGARVLVAEWAKWGEATW